MQKQKSVISKIENNLKLFKMGEVVPAQGLSEQIQKLNENDRDYQSCISKFCLLKALLNTANLIHLNEIELTYWHIVNLKMIEVGLWSKFKF